MRPRPWIPFPALIFAVSLAAHAPGGAEWVAVDLRSDGQRGVAVSSAAPRLSWRVESAARAKSQTAWQVLVAASERSLGQDLGDHWDSGKVAGRPGVSVAYGGKPLEPGRRYYWKVRSWDEGGAASPWSATAVMEVAPLSPADWRGALWMDDGRENPENEEGFYEDDPAPLMRREFEVAKPVTRARLHLAGLGYALASVNGKRLADQVLDPPWTDFDRRILFRSHDVTGSLTEGRNCLGLTLGNGWYNLAPLRMWGRRIFRETLPSGRPRVIALLVIDHPDGTQTTVTTGADWRVIEGPSRRNGVFIGELRDARLAKEGWDRAGFDASAWKPVRVLESPLEPLQPLLDMPPVRGTDVFPAVAVTTPSAGVHVVDFGKNFTGVPVMTVRGAAGTRIVLRYGELLHEDGTLNPMTSVAGQIKGTRKDAAGNEVSVGGPGAPPVAWQEDVFIKGKDGPEVYSPEFTFHGFRYLEVTGLAEAPRVGDFRGVFLRSDLPDAGSFSCSDELLNRIQEITRRTFLANVVSVQSDCPHRERLAYGGDIVATSEAYLMNFDMSGFYAKTVRDWGDAAREDGNFTDTSPFVGIQYCGVGWAMVHPLLLEQLHQHYGDVDLVREQLPAAIRWLDGEAARRKDGLVTDGLGDHESLPRIAGPVMLTPMFVDSARRVSRLARVIGMADEARRFEKMAEESVAAWRAAFLNAETGQVGGGSQSEQAFAIGHDMVPKSARGAVMARLIARIEEGEGGPALTTGIFGTQILLEELSASGRHDLAYALATRRTFPSWGWMLENGATTLWESWNFSDGTFSHSHPMFGSVSGWFFRWLGGIQAAPDAVGFDRIRIRPQVVDGLEWVKTSHQSVRGRIESNWSVRDGVSTFEVVVPPDTTAMIELPAAAGAEVTEAGGPLESTNGLRVLRAEPGLFRLQVGGGSYRFTVKPAP